MDTDGPDAIRQWGQWHPVPLMPYMLAEGAQVSIGPDLGRRLRGSVNDADVSS